MPEPAGNTIAVIGYGSLMSGLGLRPFKRLSVHAAGRVVLSNARRGFAKHSQYGDRLALALDPIDASRPITAAGLQPDAPAHALQAIRLDVGAEDFDAVCAREGYAVVAARALRHSAQAGALPLAAWLWDQLTTAAFDIAAYRRRLFEHVHYTSAHYIPHPVRLDNDYAVVFLAPGVEGTGSDAVVPVRLQTGHRELVNASTAWRQRPTASQLQYLGACVLGAAHGICVEDLMTSIRNDEDVSARLYPLIIQEAPDELARFLAHTGMDDRTYRRAFGPPQMDRLQSVLCRAGSGAASSM